ncbi:hypothetical protein ACFE04_016216 [Oxalis oulophora]
MSMQIATDGQLLHGIIHVTVDGIDKLPSGWRINLCAGQGAEGILSSGKRLSKYIARMLLCRTHVGSYHYATVDLDKVRLARTATIEGQDARPRWNESFRLYCAHQVKNIVFTVKENDPVAATLIGRAYVPVEYFSNGAKFENWVEIVDESRNPIPGHSKIYVSIKYTSVLNDPDIRWGKGIPGQQFTGVPNTYFKQKEHCRVTLYQDAHVADNFNPRIPLSGGKYYEPHKCWEDIFDAISNARHFIYITGWSVYTKITLIRDPRKPNSVTLGDLLVQKANAGVTVLMLVWDDESSVELDILGKEGLMNTPGLMGTHDENTKTFFEKTKVHCVLCPRNILLSKKQQAAMAALKPLSMVQRVQNYTMFTHHQKSIILDFPEFYESEKRRIISFIGGIDLCDGRYDTQDHPLFSTLSMNSTHHDDFHQPNFPGASIKKGGPREPWHDIHCKIEGPAAFDVMKNFEQRWRLQGGDPQLLVQQNKFEASAVPYLEQSETWNVQVFRSIDSVAAAGFPEDPKDAREQGLVTGKQKVIDRSIQDAYINAIRRAKNFIYIENQYFIGSSYAWKNNKDDIGSWNLVPKELSLKIVSKINAGERFTVYVVIPMWPEGVPESKSVQAILNWQKRTMEMMYTDVAQALRRRGYDTDPREYLTFLCLGNRETQKHGEYQPTEKPEAGSDYSKAQQARRFMIYVHSKMMIVDDEYIIIGSANINQRSLDGSRDTEIAMGAYQPYHLSTNRPSPKGQIYGFRMSLWREHLGLLEAVFENPASRECMLRVNEITDENWREYSRSDQVRDLPSHLLRYPVEVNYGGEVAVMPHFKFFPDTNAEVLGKEAFDYPFPLLTS